MIATAPFDIAEGVPGNSDPVSAFPAAERAFREVVEDALAVEHDLGDSSTNKTARHKFGRGSTAARDAISNWPLGGIWFNTDFTPTQMQQVSNATGPVWEDIGGAPTGFDFVPLGTVLPYAGSTEPTGWIFCYGQAISRTTYADLFAVISTTFGSGDGSTTFNVPDLRGRVVAGQDDMGGSSANRLTNQTGGLNGDTLGATGGAETHTLTEAQMPSHTHTASTSSSGAHTHTVPFENPGSVANGGPRVDDTNNTVSFNQTTSSNGAHTHTVTVNNAGSGSAHNNVQPTIILNYIIRAT